MFGNNKKQMASCPFNANHIFQKQKFVFHIQRCKDKQRMMPLMSKCQYNPMHYVLKDKIKDHQQFCQNRIHDQLIIKQYQQKFEGINNERRNRSHSRSRQGSQAKSQGSIKVKRDEQQNIKIKQEAQQHDHQNQDKTFSDCQQCQDIWRIYRQKLITNNKLRKLMKAYQQKAGYSIL